MVVTAYGDMPLVTAETFRGLVCGAREDGACRLSRFRARDPAAYGRVLLDADGLLDRIVEFKDASESERQTDLCNAGCYAADAQKFFRWAAKLENDNAQKRILPHRRSAPRAAGRRRVRGGDRRGNRGRRGQQPRRTGGGGNADAGAYARRGAGGGRQHDRAGDRVSSLRHGARAGCRDRAFCGVRSGRDGEERGADPKPSPIWKARKWDAARSSGRTRGCGPAPRSARTPISAISWK